MMLATPKSSDDVLIRRVASGDSAAFAELVARHQSAVRRLCCLILRDAARADEIAQEVFVTLWTERRRYHESGHLRAYLCTIARRRALSDLRRQKVARLFALGQSPEATATPFAHIEGAALFAKLLRLPENFRVPVYLRVIEELDYSEIARVIGRTESAARSRVFYGLKALSQGEKP